MALAGQQLCLELGTTASFAVKQAVRQLIVQHGGQVLLLPNKAAAYLVATEDIIARGSFKIDSAKKLGVSVISVDQLSQLIGQQSPSMNATRPPPDTTPQSSSIHSSSNRIQEVESQPQRKTVTPAAGAQSQSLAASGHSEPPLSVPPPASSPDTATIGPSITPVKAAFVPEESARSATPSAPSLSSPIIDPFGGVFMDPEATQEPLVDMGHPENSDLAQDNTSVPLAPGPNQLQVEPPTRGSAMPSSEPICIVPPEEQVFWDAKRGLGWRRKDVFERKRAHKRIELELTAEDKRVMATLSVDSFNFPELHSLCDSTAVAGPSASNDETQTRSELGSQPNGFVSKTRTVIDPKAKWVDVVKNDPSIRKKIIPPSYVGQKIFVGSIHFDDIVAKTKSEQEQRAKIGNLLQANRKKGLLSKKKLKQRAKKPVEVWSEEQAAEAIAARKQMIRQLFERFGKVIDIQENWNDEYIFVTYKNKDDAETAVKTLKNGEARKALCRDMRASLVESNKDKIIAPRHDFYVKWPEYYVKWRAKRREKTKEKKKKAAASPSPSSDPPS